MSERKQYSSEFKREAVRLMSEGGLSLSAASQQLGVARSVLGKWRRQLQQEHEVRRSGSESYMAFPGQGRPHDDELAQLRRENGALRMERDVLKKALVIFAEPRGK